MTITVEQVLALHPCSAYPESRLRRLFPATLHEVLTRWDGAWADVAQENRLWLAGQVLPRQLVRRWLAVVVERTLNLTTDPDSRSLAVLPYLRDGVEVPAAVRSAAYSASLFRAVNRSSSHSAHAAAFAAGEMDYKDAAACCVGAAAASAYAAAARDAERRQQIADLLRIVEKDYAVVAPEVRP
jgi:hypothetical protein